MRLSRFPTLIIILSIPISLYAQPPEILSDEAYQAVLQFYQYDEGMPLDARVVEKQLTPDYIREKVVVNGIRDSRVPAYLGYPTVKASVACVTPLNIWAPEELAVGSPFNFARGIGKRPFLMLMGQGGQVLL
jgi:hypothetical protein